MREPWFRIIDVSEGGRRSMADIAKQVADRHRVRLDDMRGERRDRNLAAARREAWAQIKRERPDLTSSQVAIYFHKNGSTIRHVWRETA